MAQVAVKRNLDMLTIDEFAKELTQVQEDYIAAKAAGTADALKQSFLAISDVQVWPNLSGHTACAPVMPLLCRFDCGA